MKLKEPLELSLYQIIKRLYIDPHYLDFYQPSVINSITFNSNYCILNMLHFVLK